MYPPQIEAIRREREDFNKRKLKAGQWNKTFGDGLLRTKTANEWMIQEFGKPAARPLFGSLWFENELCILYADTNMGKSVLAVQIADCLTKCYSFEPFYNQADEPLKVLYIDFELNAKQFEARYIKQAQRDTYLFSPNFYRSEFNPEADDGIASDNYGRQVRDAITTEVSKTKANVLIIDNITYAGNGTQNANAALSLMKALKALKIKFGLSILVLAHTPKRNAYKPLTVNDLQGSKMLINFADSAFAIGQSYAAPGMRYIKQIKQRNQKEAYGEDNICLIRQEKQINFLCYTFEGYAREADHLRRPETQEKQILKQQILEMHQKGHNLRQIADELGVHYTTVGRILKRSETADK
ncbi:AAA family ATPase [uncultured Mucilaginibacter sp.]|uniref:AAA family ATPase n=1 Tax=uncultured Mucilaginibacter sp. TaxID=797541 RepID=UPI0025F9CFBC|nr:AAA family ATPase [uncultured Mucilaginibacter sp.]